MKKKVLITILIIILIIAFLILGVFFRFNKITIRIPKNAKPVFYSGAKGESDMDTIWCGTFQLAWNELINQYGKEIDLKDYNSELIDKLNKQSFTKDMLSEDSYYIKVAETTPSLKEEIKQEMKKKFGKNSAVLDNIDFNQKNGITIYTALNKKFEFLEIFDDLEDKKFGETDKIIKCFGIDKKSDKSLYKNVEVMYYGWNKESEEWEYAAKLKTKENEEVILANISSIGDFDETYKKVLELENTYEETKEFQDIDIIEIPYMNINFTINYEELCRKEINNTRNMVSWCGTKYTIFYESKGWRTT